MPPPPLVRSHTIALHLCGSIVGADSWRRLISALYALDMVATQRVPDDQGGDTTWSVAPGFLPEPGPVFLSCRLPGQIRLQEDAPASLRALLGELGLGYVWCFDDPRVDTPSLGPLLASSPLAHSYREQDAHYGASQLHRARVAPWWRPHAVSLTLVDGEPVVPLRRSKGAPSRRQLLDADADRRLILNGAFFVAATAHQSLAQRRSFLERLSPTPSFFPMPITD